MINHKGGTGSAENPINTCCHDGWRAFWMQD